MWAAAAMAQPALTCPCRHCNALHCSCLPRQNPAQESRAGCAARLDQSTNAALACRPGAMSCRRLSPLRRLPWIGIAAAPAKKSIGGSTRGIAPSSPWQGPTHGLGAGSVWHHSETLDATIVRHHSEAAAFNLNPIVGCGLGRGGGKCTGLKSASLP